MGCRRSRSIGRVFLALPRRDADLLMLQALPPPRQRARDAAVRPRTPNRRLTRRVHGLTAQDGMARLCSLAHKRATLYILCPRRLFSAAHLRFAAQASRPAPPHAACRSFIARVGLRRGLPRYSVRGQNMRVAL